MCVGRHAIHIVTITIIIRKTNIYTYTYAITDMINVMNRNATL